MIHPSQIIIAGLFLLAAVPSLAIFFKVIRKEQILKRPRVASQPVEPPSSPPYWVTRDPGPLRFDLDHGFLDIIPGDLAKAEADVIVNAGNPEMRVSVGVFGDLYRMAGAGLRDACQREVAKNGPLQPGQAMVTPAFRLKAKHVIHVVTPRWQGGDQNELNLLAQGYHRGLELAMELKARSMAFPALGCGIHKIPKNLAVPVALEVLFKAMEHGTMDRIAIYLPKFIDCQLWASWVQDVTGVSPSKHLFQTLNVQLESVEAR